MNEYYTYELCSSKTPTIPFYIGKGKGNRLNHHERRILKKYRFKNNYLKNKISKIIKEGNTIL